MRRRRRPGWTALLVAAALAGGLLLGTPVSAGAARTARTARTVPRVVRGTLTLAGRGEWTRTDGRGCEGSGLYGDVGAGTSVTVRDLTGHVLLATSLRGGVRRGGCRFAFVLRRLPRSVVYGIVIGPLDNIVYQDLFSSSDDRLTKGGLQFVIGGIAP